MAVIYNSSKIVTDGLVFCLDPANPRCDIDATNVKDIILKSEFELLNGAEIGSNYVKSLIFDGTNDVAATSIPSLNFAAIGENFTIDVICRSLDSSAPNSAACIGTDGWHLGNFFGSQWNWRISGPDEGSGSVSSYVHLGLSINDSTIYHFQLYKDHPLIGGRVIKVEDDSIAKSDFTTNWDSQGDTLSTGSLTMGRAAASSNYLNCEIFSVRIYNKVLSSEEMDINRASLRRRFV